MARTETYLMMYLRVVRARRTFLGAHLTVDVRNNFQSKSHVTEFTGEIEQKPKLLVEFTNLSQIDLDKAITLPI